MRSEELNETRLPEAMHAAVADLIPPPTLPEAGLKRGRHLRKVRNFQIATCAAVSLALVAVGGTVVASGVGGGTTTKAASPSRPSPRPATAEASPPAHPIPQDKVLRTFKSLLPSGGKLTGVSAMKGDFPTFTAIYDDGRGPAGFDFAVVANVTDDSCPPVTVRPYDNCTVTNLSGGAKLVIDQGYTRPNKAGGEKWWWATLAMPNHTGLQFSEYNSKGEKSAEGTTRTDPPLDPAQLKALLTSSAWKPILEAIPAGAPQQPGPPPAMSGTKALGFLRPLLPGALTVSNVTTGNDALVSMLVDDGKGRSDLEFQIQTGMWNLISGIHCDQRTARSPISHCTETRLADGGYLWLTVSPGDKDTPNIVVNEVDLLYRDGRRVSLRSVNAISESAQPTRATPPLSLDQLKAIATNPTWRNN